ncbi:MAG: arginine--tRNA ligase [Candidatus Hydrogenedentes bacterium]|nr:arginine--tRNA ligase [Candidatus Hydrogenedentota bacterium]
MYLHIVEDLKTTIIERFPEISEEEVNISSPPDLRFGDIAVPLFVLAKKLGVSFSGIGEKIIGVIRDLSYIDRAELVGGYLNLFLKRNLYARETLIEIFSKKEKYGSVGLGKEKKALIEHTSINPNASPHVGRARNAMIGDSLSRLLKFEGYDTEVHYYVNDMGRQIGLLVLIADELEGLDFNGILDAYVKANRRAEEDEEFAKRGYDLLAKMEEGDEETRKKFYRVTELCLQGQLEVLKRLGVEYNCFDRESSFLHSEELEKVLNVLREKGALFVDEEGRLTVDLSKLGYSQEEGRYFVLRRANGSSMYGYRDLAYTIYKGKRGSDVNLIVLGEDHKLYAQQLELILKSAGYSSPECVFYSYILLKEGKMSTRQGNVVLLSDFLDKASELALQKVKQQCVELSENEQKLIAEKIAVSAIRFAVLKVSPTKNVVFDYDSALSFEGDTGPYLQYGCARIKSILRKYGKDIGDEIGEDFSIKTDDEWIVVRRLSEFPEVVVNSLVQRNPAIVANYALELVRRFTTFYHNCPVLQAEEEALKYSRLQLCKATLQTLENALSLLGIPVLERM